MFLRHLSTAASVALRCGANDGGFLAALGAVIAHELSSSPSSESSPPSLHSQGILDFSTVPDAPRAQDVLLRRRRASEEVLVSALPAPLRFEGEEPLPRDALLKVFVSKPGVTPVMRFDCRAYARGGGGAADYDVTAVWYHSLPGDTLTLERTGMKGRSSGDLRRAYAFHKVHGISKYLDGSLQGVKL